MCSVTENNYNYCTFNAPHAGRDLNVYIIQFRDNEREFIVTHKANIKPVTYFTGRETELKVLRQRIEEKRKSVLVSGMGGIGKTHICRKLFDEYYVKHSHNEDVPFQHIGYIEYNGDMGSSLQESLKYKEQTEKKLNQEAAWRELEYLASDGKLLLFVDNVNKSTAEDPSLERLKSIPGAIIVTSRRVSFGKEFESYHIGFLDYEECKEIYERIRFYDSGKKVEDEETPDLKYIIEKMAAKHTITIEFLGNLARTKHWSVKELREELEKNGFQLEYKDEEDKVVNIQEAYETLYNLSELTKAEQNILEAFSIFPYIMLSAEICNQWLLSDAGVGEKEDILVGLYRKGWLQFDINQESYALHPVFAQFIYDKCKPNTENHIGLIKACQNSLEIPESGYITECQNYIPFAENIIEKLDIGKDIERVDFLSTLAFLLQYIAEYKKAEKLCKKRLEIEEDTLGEDNLDVAKSYHNLAFIYEQQGEYIKAEELYIKSLKIKEKVLERDHSDILNTYNNLAIVYEQLGELKKAQEIFEKIIPLQKSLYGEIHPDIARAYNNLGYVYELQEDYKKAEELYRKGLNIFECAPGEDHPDTAGNYFNLATVLTTQEKYKEAEELLKKSLRIYIRAFGEDNPTTANVYCNLSYIYIMLEYYEVAEELLKRALPILEEVFGKDHPDTMKSYHNLALVYEMQGEYDKADRLYKKSQLTQEDVLQDDFSDIKTPANLHEDGEGKENQKNSNKKINGFLRRCWERIIQG